MRDLAALTPGDFEPLIGTAFAVALGELPSLAIQLIEVAARGPQPGRRTPFALYFTGPASPVLEPLAHLLSHPVLGELELFIGPVMSTGPGITYEAIFA